MALEKDFFRQVMGRFATGVTVVTAKSPKGVAGLTVNTFCSVSLNPPLILVCVDLNSQTLPYIRESGAYAVNMLTVEQEHLSRCFATPSLERYERFCGAEYTEAVTGSPIIVAQSNGETITVDKPPLAYYRGQYRHLTNDYTKPSLAVAYNEEFERR